MYLNFTNTVYTWNVWNSVKTSSNMGEMEAGVGWGWGKGGRGKGVGYVSVQMD